MTTTTKNTNATRIEDLTNLTSDAYSYDRYRSWKSVITLLVKAGYTVVTSYGLYPKKSARVEAIAAFEAETKPVVLSK